MCCWFALYTAGGTEHSAGDPEHIVQNPTIVTQVTGRTQLLLIAARQYFNPAASNRPLHCTVCKHHLSPSTTLEGTPPPPRRLRVTGPSVDPQLTSCSPPSAALLAATGTSVSSALVCVPPCLILTLFSSVTPGSCLYPVPFSLSCSVSPDSLSPHSCFPLSPFSAKARDTCTFLTFPFMIYSRSIQILYFWIY